MWERVRDLALEIGGTAMCRQDIQVTSGKGASIDRAAELALCPGSDACCVYNWGTKLREIAYISV